MTPPPGAPPARRRSRPSSGVSTSSVCSPTHGTRVSGPSATLESFTGLPGTRTGSVERRRAAASRRACGGRDVGVGDDLGGAVARAGDDARPPQRARRFELRACRRPRLDRGPDLGLEVRGPTGAGRRSADRRPPLRLPDEVAELRRTGARARSAPRRSRRGLEALEDHLRAPCRLGPHAERPEVRDDVGHRDHRVEHRDVDVLPLARAVAVAQRGQEADRAEQRGADVAERADRDVTRRLVGLR